MKGNKAQINNRYQIAKKQLELGTQSADAVCAELFGLGYELEISGQSDAADSLYQQTIDLLEDIKAQPGSSLTDLKLARIAFGHGKSLLRFSKPRAAIAAFRRSLETIECSLGGSLNGVLLEKKANILGWLGLAQRKAGHFEDSKTSYLAAIEIWQKLPDMIGAPISPYQGFLGACLLGVSKTYSELKCFDEAENAKMESGYLLEKEFELLKNSH